MIVKAKLLQVYSVYYEIFNCRILNHAKDHNSAHFDYKYI